MNYYYVAGFILFCMVFFIWAAALDKTPVKNRRTEAEKFNNKIRSENLEARKRAHRQSLNSMGRSSLDDDLLDPTNMLNPLNPLSPLYIYDDNDTDHQSQSGCSGDQGGQGQSVDSFSGGGGYSGSGYSSDSGGSSYSSSDSGSSSCSGGSD